MAEHSLPQDSGIKPIVNRSLWARIGKFIPQTVDKLPQKIGKFDGLTIWLVDGDKVRRRFYMDFSYGGHDLVYGRNNTEYEDLSFIPPKQIWLDGHIDHDGLQSTLYHELIERELMDHKKMPYPRAHKIANLSEKSMHPKANGGFPRESMVRAIASMITEDPDVITEMDFDTRGRERAAATGGLADRLRHFVSLARSGRGNEVIEYLQQNNLLPPIWIPFTHRINERPEQGRRFDNEFLEFKEFIAQHAKDWEFAGFSLSQPGSSHNWIKGESGPISNDHGTWMTDGQTLFFKATNQLTVGLTLGERRYHSYPSKPVSNDDDAWTNIPEADIKPEDLADIGQVIIDWLSQESVKHGFQFEGKVANFHRMEGQYPSVSVSLAFSKPLEQVLNPLPLLQRP